MKIHGWKNELWPISCTTYKINSKLHINWMWDIKIFKEKTCVILWFYFLRIKENHNLPINNKFNFIKIINFCPSIYHIKKMKRQATAWEKTFANDTADKGVTARIHKEFS